MLWWPIFFFVNYLMNTGKNGGLCAFLSLIHKWDAKTVWNILLKSATDIVVPFSGINTRNNLHPYGWWFSKGKDQKSYESVRYTFLRHMFAWHWFFAHKIENQKCVRKHYVTEHHFLKIHKQNQCVCSDMCIIIFFHHISAVKFFYTNYDYLFLVWRANLLKKKKQND